MTIDISNNDPRISYSVAQGVTQTSFVVPFEFFDDSDVNVYVDGTLKTITTDYTISGGGGSTGTVNISVTGGAGGSVVVLTRDITIERTTDFTAGADINRAALNTQLDTLTAIAADVKDRAGLALSYNDRTVGVPIELPDVAALKGNTLAFNASTGAPEAGPSIADVANAQTNAVNAAASATAAAGSASAAATSATAAAGSETAAAGSATAAASSETAAAASATAAAASETAAETAETNTLAIYGSTQDVADAVAAAAASEAAAAASETAAAASEAAAATSASNAATSATNAASSASSASTSATSATTSATNASNSATAAASSASAASASETAAAASETAAAASETAAAASETAAAASESAAAISETNAASSESSASTSASNAATSETNAANSATAAATSATSAASSATAASASADAALAALDSFDDRYLGQKTSDPTLDNDGNPLVAGALYFNTTDDVMKVYEGSVWVAAYASLSGALLVSNNLSDVADTAASRINLGLGSAATTASTDYATASQGALADSAVQPNDSPTFGNITVTGTVDGRDVAADGTKLDGIEAGATADQTITAGSGLTGGGTGNVTISHADTSSQASVDNSGATVIQDVTVDTYGHVTGLGSATLTAAAVGAPSTNGTGASGNWGINITGNAATATSATDSSKLPLSGGTMTGALNTRTSTVNTANSGSTGTLDIMGNASGGAVFSLHRAGAYAVNMGLDTDNVFRIGGWSAAANRLQMDMSGNLTMAGNVTAYSDIRLKEDLEVITGALDKVKSLTGYTYTRIDSGERHTGVIAQDVEKVLPEAVNNDGEHLSVAYGNMVGLLIEAIKEQQAQIDDLKARLEV